MYGLGLRAQGLGVWVLGFGFWGFASKNAV